METGQLINQISHRLRRRSMEVQRSLGISETQGRILNFVLVESAKHPVHPKEVEEEFGLRSSTVTGILADLERGGLIRRETDPEDGRQKIISFTPKADSIRGALQAEIDETERRMLRGITAEEREQFLVLARQMLKNLDGRISEEKKEDERNGE